LCGQNYRRRKQSDGSRKKEEAIIVIVSAIKNIPTILARPSKAYSITGKMPVPQRLSFLVGGQENPPAISIPVASE